MQTAPVARGCGRRVKGGVYAESHQGEGGTPIEWFVVDPPAPLDLGAIGVRPRGVTLVRDESLADGTCHIVDWVGAESYPNVADFVEEARRFGISRRLETTLDFSRITDRSRLVLVHPRAICENRLEIGRPLRCPKDRLGPEKGWTSVEDAPGARRPARFRDLVGSGSAAPPRVHTDPAAEMCAEFWYRDLEGAEQAEGLPDGELVRRMPSFEYRGRRDDPDRPRIYCPAVFMVAPVHAIALVDDPGHPAHMERIRRRLEDCGARVREAPE